MVKAHIFILGRVQGVFYRNWTVKKARQLGLSGWVRNRIDGKVEAVILGKNSDVKKMIEWFWQGPPLAKVEKVEIVSFKKVEEDIFRGKFEKRKTV